MKEFPTNGYNADVKVRLCFYRTWGGPGGSNSSGSRTCRLPSCGSYVNLSGNTGDGHVRYNVNDDGKGNQTWGLQGHREDLTIRARPRSRGHGDGTGRAGGGGRPAPHQGLRDRARRAPACVEDGSRRHAATPVSSPPVVFGQARRDSKAYARKQRGIASAATMGDRSVEVKMRKLATLQILASNGVLFIEDPDLPLSEAPDLDELPVAASRSRIVVQVQHAVDGLAAVSVLDGAVETALPVEYYDGEFLSESGYMAVRDVVGWNRITLDVGKESSG